MEKLFAIFLILLSCVSYAQVPEPTLVSLKGFGGNGYSKVLSSVTKTEDGGFIIGINSNAVPGSGNLDSFCNGLSGDRAIFLKYNADASILNWSKCTIEGSYIFPQNDGNFVFGGITTSVPSGWAFKILKEDSSGTYLWYKTYGGEAASAILRGMIATDDGGYIMMGVTNYTDTDFTVHYGSFMNDDIAIIKVDGSGNKVWSKVLGGSGEDQAISIISAPGDGCYIVGTTYSNDHDCIGNHGGDDIFLARLDKNGNILWHKDIGGSGGEDAACATTNGNGGIIIGGASNSNDGDRTHFPTFGCPIWTLEVDSSSNILWNNCYGGGGGNCYANSICKATDGSIWIAGVSSLPGNEVDTNYGRDDAWFVHVDNEGNFINARVMGSNLWDRGTMIYPLSNSNVIAGGFYDTAGAAFASIITYSSYPNSNAFLSIFAPSNQTSIKPISFGDGGLEVYPNPCVEMVSIEAIHHDQNFRISITDVLGRLVLEGALDGKLQVTTKDWLKGLYYVKVISENGYKEVQKLEVQ